MVLKFVFLAVLFFSPCILLAQGAIREPVVPIAVEPQVMPYTYGTTSTTVYSMGAWDFEGYDSNVVVAAQADYRYVTAGCCVQGIAHLPNGALITTIELEACDTSANSQVEARLFYCPDGGGGCLLEIGVSTGGNGVPGCTRFPSTFFPPLQIDNNANEYLVRVSTGNTNETRFGSVRLFYKLQVSPTPATATFADVSNTHPFYQFIEALAAAGITAGCTPPPNPNYCPNDLLTRGQLAVFLARALGLHWPN